MCLHSFIRGCLKSLSDFISSLSLTVSRWDCYHTTVWFCRFEASEWFYHQQLFTLFIFTSCGKNTVYMWLQERKGTLLLMQQSELRVSCNCTNLKVLQSTEHGFSGCSEDRWCSGLFPQPLQFCCFAPSSCVTSMWCKGKTLWDSLLPGKVTSLIRQMVSNGFSFEWILFIIRYVWWDMIHRVLNFICRSNVKQSLFKMIVLLIVTYSNL